MLRQIRILLAVFAFALIPQFADAGPIAGPDGISRFPFGQRTPPTLRCTPLFVCDLVLEPGETIVNVAVGDSVRWLIAPASSGPTEAAIPHVLIKPTEAGLHTNLIVTTNRRTYYLALVSQDRDPMLRLGFLYPQDPQRAFALALPSPTPSTAPVLKTTPPTPQTPIDKLDFDYQVSGERSLQPLRVFNDGAHTYLQMPPGLSEIPVLFAVGSDGRDTLVNYRFTGQFYVIDGVPPRIALVAGSGKQQRRALVGHGS